MVRRRAPGADGERGAVLPIFVASFLALVGMAAFAIDLGWAYVNGERMQRAADAAALAAVVDLPPDAAVWEATRAYGTAVSVAGKNGYAPGEVTPKQVFTRSGNLVPNRIRVDVSQRFDTFFFKIFGVDTIRLTRSATAEFLPPLQLGSDLPELGAFPAGVGCDPAAPVPGCIDPADPSTWGGTNPGIWVAINGIHTAKEQGDPYTTRCLLSNSTNSCQSANGEFEPRGNFYGVEVPGGASVLSVELFDPVFWGSNVTQQIGAGDQKWVAGGEFTTHFQLLAPDATPANPMDNTAVLCARSFAPDVGAGPFDPGSPTNFAAFPLCTVGTRPGLHVVRVFVDGGVGHAANGFSIRASTDSGQPAVYGIGRMSLRTNQPSSSPRFKLAKVPPGYAGRKLTVSLFDPGEAAGNAYVSFKGEITSWPCTYTVRRAAGGVSGPFTPSGTFGGSRCWVQSASGGGSLWNGDWLDFTFDVPNDYDCDFQAGGCWWEVQYNYSAPGVHDRTTWEVNVKGTPVRLVFDG